jgi:hypothetical protein
MSGDVGTFGYGAKYRDFRNKRLRTVRLRLAGYDDTHAEFL